MVDATPMDTITLAMTNRIFTNGNELWIPFDGATTSVLFVDMEDDLISEDYAKKESIQNKMNVFMMNFNRYLILYILCLKTHNVHSDVSADDVKKDMAVSTNHSLICAKKNIVGGHRIYRTYRRWPT